MVMMVDVGIFDIPSSEPRTSAVSEADIALPFPSHLRTFYARCGKSWCRCKAAGPIHGPYYLLRWRSEDGKDRTRYVKREDVDRVRATLAGWREQRRTVNAAYRVLMQLYRRRSRRALPA